MSSITPYRISVPESRLEDLKTRLARARYPDELDSAGWDLGTPLSDVQRLTKYWLNHYDWRATEEKLSRLPHFVTSIQCEGFESLTIHFLHQKSEVEGAVPLLFVHGWPGSFLEGTKILDTLAFGNSQGHAAFDVVVPSLPNYGFSDGTTKRGFAIEQYAETLHKLMLRLGYDQYVTQGGDWGWYITRAMAYLFPSHCKATHLNSDVGRAPSFLRNPLLTLRKTFRSPTKRERRGLPRSKYFYDEGSGYNLLQSTKPQTLGYALADSPVALLAWIYEKLREWTDDYPWTDDEVCTWLSIYWFSTAGPAASCRLYYEMAHSPGGIVTKKLTSEKLEAYLPHTKVGMSHFPMDIHVLPHEWTATIGEVVFEREHDTGGHFAAWEKPEAIVRDLQDMFGRGGGAYGVVKGRDGY